MTDKEKYIHLSINNESIYIPIFQQPFWLDSFTEKWDVILYEMNGKVIAAVPFALKGILITKRIYLSDVSFYQSILFFEDVRDRNKIASVLFSHLPKTIKQYFKFLPEYIDIDLDVLGYKRTYYQTHFIQQKIKLSNHHQRKINKVQNSNFSILTNQKVDEAYALIQQTFDRQKIKFKLSLSAFQYLFQVCNKYNCGYLYSCFDGENNLLATALIISDAQIDYYLFGAFNMAFKNSGAMHFLLNHVIENTLKDNKKFNFCGSSKTSIAHFFQGFGGIPTAIPIWTKLF